MRKILLCGTAVFALTVGAAAAGGLGEPVMEPEVVEAATSSSAGGLIVPLLLLILIVAAASGGDSAPVGGPSDARIKTDIAWVGMVKGNIPVYRYRYIGSATRFEGVMAQDILNIQPDAVVHWSNGMMGVNYAKLGLKMKVIH